MIIGANLSFFRLLWDPRFQIGCVFAGYDLLKPTILY